MSKPLSVLTGNRDFRRLFAAELVVFGADWFVLIPLPRLTGSGVWGGLVLAADTGVNALLMPFTGTVADRYDRRRILITANLAAFAACLLLFTVRSAATAPLALVAIALMAVAKAFYTPASSAALPNVVEPADLVAANTISGSAWGTMTVLGASLGGVVGAAFGPYVSFGLTAACLLTGATFTSLVRRPLQAEREETGAPARQALAESLGYLRRSPRIRALITVKSAAGLGNGVLVVFPLIAATHHAGVLGTGLLFAVRGAGSLTGPFLLRPVLRRRTWLLPGLALSMSLYGVGYLGVSVAPWFPIVLALVFLAHLAGGANWTLSSFALQAEVPDRLRGRVFAADLMLTTLAITVSQLAATAFIDFVDERVILGACGAVTLTYAVAWRLVTSRLGDPEITG